VAPPPVDGLARTAPAGVLSDGVRVRLPVHVALPHARHACAGWLVCSMHPHPEPTRAVGVCCACSLAEIEAQEKAKVTSGTAVILSDEDAAALPTSSCGNVRSLCVVWLLVTLLFACLFVCLVCHLFSHSFFRLGVHCCCAACSATRVMPSGARLAPSLASQPSSPPPR
jgi:hypothetical protein